MLAANTGEFSASLARWLTLTEEALDGSAREATKKMCSTIISTTPIDTTDPDDVIMRGDWVSGVDSEPGDTNRADASGDQAQQELDLVLQTWKPSSGMTFYFVNYKPYGPLLEYGGYHHNPKPKNGKAPRTTPSGFSTQAPSGFVGLEVQNFDRYMEEAARKYQR